jgi:pilus assembly protein CpaE
VQTLNEPRGRLNFLTLGDRGRGEGVKSPRIGVMEGAIGGPERLASLAAHFPQVEFESAGPFWPEGRAGKFDIIIVGVDASSAANVEQAARRLQERSGGGQVVVVLSDADVVTTRRLVREGAADVLPAPVGEPALAISIERLLSANLALGGGAPKAGELVAFIKAGGGVGATALAAQVGAMLAARHEGEVCLADLDLQFGNAAIYLDLPEALSLSEVLNAGATLQDTQFGTALATHKSGLRVLAAPRDITPLEALTPQVADMLVAGLKRDFALTLVDLPAVWTAWTNRILQLADRVVMVTELSVPHIQLVKRQLRIMTSQGLDDHPLTLVGNAVTGEQQSQVSLKAAERALGRHFDVVVPEDRRTMSSAINEGLQIMAVRRGTKLEKVVAELCAKVAAGALQSAKVAR